MLTLPAMASEKQCREDILLCDKAYQEQKELADKTEAYVKELERANEQVNEELGKERAEAGKFHHDPIAMSGIGLGTGVLAVVASPIIIPVVGVVVLIAVLFN